MGRPIASGETEHGYAMGALLVALAIMGIMLSIALPRWSHLDRRAREAELVFRGEQYARAVELYQRTYAATYPPDIETLVDERFLRRQYGDPMTEGGEFRVVYEAEAAELLGDAPTSPLPGQAAGRAAFGSDRDFDRDETVPDDGDAGADSGTVLRLDDEPPREGTRGGVVGVVSRSDDASLMIYNGGTKYSEWAFIYGPSTAAPSLGPGAASPDPIATPGQRGRSAGQSGGPGSSSPGRR